MANISKLSEFVLFADDLNLFISHKDRFTLYRLANQVLYTLYQYCSANKLIINYEKCCYIEFKTHEDDDHDPFLLGILNHPFQPEKSCKFLGVYINEGINWNDQIKNVITQVSKSCGTLYSVRKCVPNKILKKVYMALVQPYLMYCIPLWGSLHKSNLMQKLFILQKKCIRIISKKTEKIDGMLQHTKPIFQRLKILNVFNIYNYMTACEAMKIIKTKIPSTLYSLFTRSSRSNRFIFPLFNLTSIMNKSFVYNSKKLLNYLLQHDIKYHELPITSFKTRLKKHLMYVQSKSINGDDSWLPCNHDLFSNVTV